MKSICEHDPIVAKIGDFGLSQQASPSKEIIINIILGLSELLKTWQWLAPGPFFFFS